MDILTGECGATPVFALLHEMKVSPPTPEQLGETVWRRLVHEHLRPALEATTVEDYRAMCAKHAAGIMVKALALTQLGAGDVDRRGERVLVHIARDYGGEDWADAMEHSLRNAVRLREVMRRVGSLPLRDEHAVPLLEVIGCQSVWLVATMCLLALAKGDAEGTESSRRIVYQDIAHGMREAFIRLRALEIGILEETCAPSESMLPFDALSAEDLALVHDGEAMADEADAVLAT